MARKSKSTKAICHIHDRAHENAFKPAVDVIRRGLCSFGSNLKEFQGRPYCIFHLPTNKKEINLFDELFRSKLRSIEHEIERRNFNKAHISEALEENLARVGGIESDEAFNSEPVHLVKTMDGSIELTDAPYYDFRYVWFPSEITLFRNYSFSAAADFSFATFSGSVDFDTAKFKSDAEFSSSHFCSFADFKSAIFFELASFDGATFESDAQFQHAAFLSDAHFKSTIFVSNADFSSARLTSKANFASAVIRDTSQVFFDKASLEGAVDFNLAVVQGYLHFEAGRGRFFSGNWWDTGETQPKLENRQTSVFEGVLNLADLRAENPDRISFNKVRLRPSWFVNSDPRKFIFTDVNWENHLCDRSEIGNELDALRSRRYDEAHSLKLLTIAFRNLATNAEEFNRFDDASNFRKAAFECERKEKVQKSALSALVHLVYRQLSFYGESWSWAALVLIGVLLVFGMIYDSPYATFERLDTLRTVAATATADMPETEKSYKMNNAEGFVYSLYVAALQRPDPKPVGPLTRSFVILETIFAPLQFALLALAIRRKFMR